tara:strand:- start:811 stop:1251 length:441 start_codon:yes stop_codon:yes gene_type:complete
MKNTNTPASKYRPVLTAAQIEHILTLAKLESPISATSFSVIATLSPFYAKIQNNAVTAAYSTAPAASSKFSVSGLGGTSPAQPDNTTSTAASGATAKEDYWEECYNQWLITPTEMSLAGIEAAQEHRYLHGLMTPEEQASFEMGEG